MIALVGYTNAGKTTLFNKLTRSDNRAEDLLFATLDPTLRRTRLPHGTEVIISDTVGFISDLPTTLVAAFRATLEEVVEADLVLHIRDIAHSDTETQAGDVRGVLAQLGVDADSGHVIEIWNKIDLLPDTGKGSAAQRQGRRPVPMSTLHGEGIGDPLQVIEDALHAGRAIYRVQLAGARLRDLHRLYEVGEVLHRSDADDGSTIIRVRIADKALDEFLETFPKAISRGPGAPDSALSLTSDHHPIWLTPKLRPFCQCRIVEALAHPCKLALDRIEPAAEFAVGALHRALRIDLQVPRQIDDREKNIAKFSFDGLGRAGRIDLRL